MIVALNSHGQDVEVVWGKELPKRLVNGELEQPKRVYIGVDFESDELSYVAETVRRIKERYDADQDNMSRKKLCRSEPI